MTVTSKEAMEAVTRPSVLGALAGGPLRNVEIRRVIFGKGKENTDVAGSRTTQILQALANEGKVKLDGNRWSLAGLAKASVAMEEILAADQKDKRPLLALKRLADAAETLASSEPNMPSHESTLEEFEAALTEARDTLSQAGA